MCQLLKGKKKTLKISPMIIKWVINNYYINPIILYSVHKMINISKNPLLRGIRRYSDVRLSDYEQKIHNILSRQLNPESLQVQDISGGCGSMFAINVTSTKFKGLTMIKQHKLVNTILKDEIVKWHGLQLKTKAVN